MLYIVFLMSVFFNLHFFAKFNLSFFGNIIKSCTNFGHSFFYKKVVYEICMVVFVLKIAKIAWFLYGIVQELYKNWTIFFHRVGLIKVGVKIVLCCFGQNHLIINQVFTKSFQYFFHFLKDNYWWLTSILGNVLFNYLRS